jgi:L-alanine-DL-glutamate epimerase-like enolase superfamily enzyme
MAALRVSVSAIDLPLVHPFKIARGEETLTRTALVRLQCGDREGIGEATPVERYDETYDTVVEYFATHALASDDPYRLEFRPPRARASTSRCTT